MKLRMGIIGTSPRNGHPYSWAAICNGYNPQAMADCGFPAIPEYLARQTWPDDRLTGAHVTHIWTQNEAESRKIARASHIDTVVRTPEDMIGEIDALLLARDDAHNHLQFAAPFLRAGIPVYIDKPIALSEEGFDALNAVQLVDPLLTLLGHESRPKRLFAGPVGGDGRLLAIRWPNGGPDVHLMASGSMPSPLQFRIVGETGEVVLAFHDSFTAFKAALSEFISSVHEGRSRLSEGFNRRAVQIIEMGLQ